MKGYIFGFANYYYSQTGEDIILAGIFRSKKKGFYVDVGAYHPKHYSNTYLLYKKGWRGINIDPNPKSIKLFERHRKRDINIHAGVLAEERSMPYYIFNHQSHNTFSEEKKKDALEKNFVELIETKEIQCKPLAAILDSCVPTNTEIDVLTIDAEGNDLEVLKSNDWGKYKPRTIVVEDHDFTMENPQASAIYTYVTQKGYILEGKTNLSLIFIQKEKYAGK